MKSLSHNKLTWVYVITFTLLLLYTIFSERGLLRVRELSMERDNIRTSSQIIEDENNKLLSKVVVLTSNEEVMEKKARAELDLVREDEILYKFSR